MSLTERRQPILTAELVLLVGLIWLVVSAIFVIGRWPEINNLGLLGSGGLLAGKAALVIVPLLAMGAAMLLVAGLARRLFDTELIPYAVLILAMATPVTGQFQPLRIDYHGWQIIAVLAALIGLTARSARAGGWVSGIALGFGLAVGPEVLPIAVLVGAILARRWLAQPTKRGWLVNFLWAVTLTGLVLWLLGRGVADFSGSCDFRSPAAVAGLGIAALGISLLALAPRMPRPSLLLVMGLIGATALGGGLLLAPHCAAWPFATLDLLPAWQLRPAVIAQMIVPPLIGLIAALRLSGQSHAWLRSFWLEYAILLAGALLISVLDASAAGLACAMAAVPLAWQVRRWLRAAQMARRPAARNPAFAAMALAVMPGLPVIGIASVLP